MNRTAEGERKAMRPQIRFQHRPTLELVLPCGETLAIEVTACNTDDCEHSGFEKDITVHVQMPCCGYRYMLPAAFATAIAEMLTRAADACDTARKQLKKRGT